MALTSPSPSGEKLACTPRHVCNSFEGGKRQTHIPLLQCILMIETAVLIGAVLEKSSHIHADECAMKRHEKRRLVVIIEETMCRRRTRQLIPQSPSTPWRGEHWLAAPSQACIYPACMRSTATRTMNFWRHPAHVPRIGTSCMTLLPNSRLMHLLHRPH
jgi:hypothetical protein